MTEITAFPVHGIPQLLLDVPQPVWVIDADGIIVAVNDAVESQYGWDRMVVTGQHVELLFAESRRTEWHALFERCLLGDEIRGHETLRLNQAQQSIPVQVGLSPIEDAEGHTNWVALRDELRSGSDRDAVTQVASDSAEPRSQAAALVESQGQSQKQLAELEQLYETAPIGLALVDRDLRFLRINATLAEINGLPVEEHIGRTLQEVIPDVAAIVAPLYQQVFQSGEPVLLFEVSGETASQPGALRDWLVSYHPLKADTGDVFAVNSVVQEVTAARRAEQQLRQSENQMRVVLDATTDGFWDCDLVTGETIWSDASKVLSAGTDNDGLDHLSSTLHPQDRDRFNQIVCDHLEHGIALDGEFRFRQHDGAFAWLRCRGKAVRDDAGKVVRLIGINFDISESKALEQLLARQSEAERMQVSRELHDSFGQQISGIGMMVTALRRSFDADAEVQESLALLEQHVETAKTQVRSVAKGLFPVDVDASGLTAALRQLVEETDRIHEVSCQFECSQIVRVNENFVATQLFLIAREALHNAVKHSGARQIVVRLRNHDGIVVEVEDDGVGTAADVSADSGLGIRIMRHRAGRIGAVLDVRTVPAGGLLVSCRRTGDFTD